MPAGFGGPSCVNSCFYLGPVFLWDRCLVLTGLSALDNSCGYCESPVLSAVSSLCPQRPPPHTSPAPGAGTAFPSASAAVPCSQVRADGIGYVHFCLALLSSAAGSRGPSSPTDPKDVPFFTLLTVTPVPAYLAPEPASGKGW